MFAALPSGFNLTLAQEPQTHAAHVYAADALGIEATLAQRLQLLSPKEFEGLLHPVPGTSSEIISGFWMRVLSATLAEFLAQLRFSKRMR